MSEFYATLKPIRIVASVDQVKTQWHITCSPIQIPTSPNSTPQILVKVDAGAIIMKNRDMNT